MIIVMWRRSTLVCVPQIKIKRKCVDYDWTEDKHNKEDLGTIDRLTSHKESHHVCDIV